jgi:HK97 family phage major capsid protein
MAARRMADRLQSNHPTTPPKRTPTKDLDPQVLTIAHRVALVDFSKVVVARDVDAEVKVLDQTWGDWDSVGIRVVTRYDTALLQAKAVTLLTEA